MESFICAKEGETHVIEGEAIRVRGMCFDESKLGFWYCTVHQLLLRGGLQVMAHKEGAGEHVFVWVCHFHGPEVP